MFSNKDINMIFCAAGGEFLVEILPYIDFELMLKILMRVQDFRPNRIVISNNNKM